MPPVSRGCKSLNLIEVKNLKKYFPIRKTPFSKPIFVKAVNDVTLDIPKGSIFAVVGESGSGKTTLGRTILKLLDPTSGRILFSGQDITDLKPKEMRAIRRKMQIVPQDPYNSLHPRKLVKDIVGEGLKIHFKMRSSEIYERVREILGYVGLREEHMFRYPHEFSGGQRQRIAIARALVLRPEFIVLDEPTSALDVSVQARVLKLLKDLKREFSLTYLFITHDLAVVDYMADRCAVMYLGKVVEIGSKDDIFYRTSHPYTRLLMNAVPSVDPRNKKDKVIPKGEIPNPVNPPSGCPFHPRCPYAKGICKEKEPDIVEVNEGHWVKCHFPL
ncbi:MAG: oligopeptide ABC transporter ATP-binding protein [Thermotogae bacterium]|nr:MAG: oligopeptide ABC transporter ATP-binding protein [Thermotogota bacterium]